MFEQPDEKPRFESTRLGKNKSGTEAVRPVKVALNILSKVAPVSQALGCVPVTRSSCRGESETAGIGGRVEGTP